jgi:hypothetical protein
LGSQPEVIRLCNARLGLQRGPTKASPQIAATLQGVAKLSPATPTATLQKSSICRGKVVKLASSAYPAVSGRLRDLLDHLADLLFLRLERDVGLREHADQPALLEHRQPPDLVTRHQRQRLV